MRLDALESVQLTFINKRLAQEGIDTRTTANPSSPVHDMAGRLCNPANRDAVIPESYIRGLPMTVSCMLALMHARGSPARVKLSMPISPHAHHRRQELLAPRASRNRGA